jgi:hypothetical protein
MQPTRCAQRQQKGRQRLAAFLLLLDHELRIHRLGLIRAGKAIYSGMLLLRIGDLATIALDCS